MTVDPQNLLQVFLAPKQNGISSLSSGWDDLFNICYFIRVFGLLSLRPQPSSPTLSLSDHQPRT